MWPAGELCPRAKPRERCALGSVRASCDYSGVSVECRELPSETINERLSVVNDALCRSRTPLVYSGVVCVCFGLSSESLSNVGFVCWTAIMENGEWRMSVERLLGEWRAAERARMCANVMGCREKRVLRVKCVGVWTLCARGAVCREYGR